MPLIRSARRSFTVLTVSALMAAACSGGGDVATDASTTSGRQSSSSSTTRSDDDSAVPSDVTTGDAPSDSATTDETAATGSATTGSNPPSSPGTTATVPPATRPATTTDLDSVRVRVRSVGSFSVPTAYRAGPDGAGYIAEKAGRVRNFSSGAVVLDIRGSVLDNGEQGLLGIAFRADGRRMYVSYSDRVTGGTSVIAEYAFAGGRVDTSSRREILRVEQPFPNHNGGDIHTGPDGFLYIGLGDGGSGGDPRENGQNPNTLLGSILRIDPTRPAGGKAYGIPADNPFVGGGGAPEVYLYGVRNPWRFAFDSATDDLWVADVGQNQWEEITVLPATEGRGRGANLGWDNVEGSHRFEGEAPAGSVPPVFEYSHAEGCSITGGFVYRGSAIPQLRGAYLFADVCRTNLRAVRAEGRRLVDQTTFDVDVGAVIAFGVDAAGELLVLSQQGTVYRVESA